MRHVNVREEHVQELQTECNISNGDVGPHASPSGHFMALLESPKVFIFAAVAHQGASLFLAVWTSATAAISWISPGNCLEIICITHVAACVYARVCLHMCVHVQVLLLIRLDDAEENKGDADGVRGEREAGSQAYMIGSKFLITSDYDLTGFGWMRCISFVTNVCALGNGVLSCSLTCVSRLLYVCVLRFFLNTRGCVY